MAVVAAVMLDEKVHVQAKKQQRLGQPLLRFFRTVPQFVAYVDTH